MKHYWHAIFIVVMWVFLGFALLSSVGCASIREKSHGGAASSDAFKITPSNLNSGNPSLEIVAGGGTFAWVFQKAYDAWDKVSTMISFSRRKSLWGLFSGDTSATNVSLVFCAGNDLTFEQQMLLLDKIDNIVNPQNNIPQRE